LRRLHRVWGGSNTLLGSGKGVDIDQEAGELMEGWLLPRRREAFDLSPLPRRRHYGADQKTLPRKAACLHRDPTPHLLWGPTALWATVLFLLSAQSDPRLLGRLPINDEVGHFILYTVLGMALAWAGRNRTHASASVGLIFLGVLFAASDEWHQAFVPMRASSAGDFLADMAGVIFGYFILRALIQRRRFSKTSSP